MAKFKSKLKRRRRGIESAPAQIVLIVFLIINIFLVFLPVLITIMQSLKTPYEFSIGFWVFPETPQFQNYVKGITNIWGNLINSLIVCVIVTFGVVFLSSVVAYVFTIYDFPLKEFLFALILALMMVPGVLTMTPQYLNIFNLGLKNTHWALIFPGIAGGQVGAVFLFRTFFGQQPRALFENATIDGASDFICYTRITLPLAVPVLIIQGVGTFSGTYNDYIWPMLVIDNSQLQTLMPRLKYLADLITVSDPGVPYAMYLLSGIPLIIIASFSLKYFINGDFAAGMKL